MKVDVFDTAWVCGDKRLIGFNDDLKRNGYTLNSFPGANILWLLPYGHEVGKIQLNESIGLAHEFGLGKMHMLIQLHEDCHFVKRHRKSLAIQAMLMGMHWPEDKFEQLYTLSIMLMGTTRTFLNEIGYSQERFSMETEFIVKVGENGWKIAKSLDLALAS